MASHDDEYTESPPEPTVSDIMTPAADVVTIGPDATLHDLVVLMQEKGTSGMPVVDDEGCVIGIVTEGDLVVEDADLDLPGYFRFVMDLNPLKSHKKFEEQLRKTVGATVADIMTTEIGMVSPDDPASAAAEIMVDKRVNRVPVVDDDDHLVGVVCRMDIIRMLDL